MSVKSYIKKNYEGDYRDELLNQYTAHKGIMSGNFYNWENEFLQLSQDEQNKTSLVQFLERKVEQVIEAAKALQAEELAKEQEEKEEASGESEEK